MRNLILLSLLLVLGACTSVQYVPVETTKTDSVYISQLEKDSVYLRDSIYVREKNDTVYVDKVRYLYKEKTIRDTMYSERVDSILVPYPVERKLGKWEQIYIEVGKVTFWIVVITVLVVVGRLVYRLIK